MLTESGTLVMPTFSEGRFDPSEWGNPPVSETLWSRYRYEVPLYDARKTPVDSVMSRVYELFRNWPDVIRTEHPHTSFAAWGAQAEAVCVQHELACRLGESSPLARLYDLGAQVLFIGTGFDTCTSFHLSEYRQENPPRRTFLTVQSEGGEKSLHEYEDVDTDSSVFAVLGADFVAQASVGSTIREQTIGDASCLLFAMPEAVDFGVHWYAAKNNS